MKRRRGGLRSTESQDSGDGPVDVPDVGLDDHEAAPAVLGSSRIRTGLRAHAASDSVSRPLSSGVPAPSTSARYLGLGRHRAGRPGLPATSRMLRASARRSAERGVPIPGSTMRVMLTSGERVQAGDERDELDEQSRFHRSARFTTRTRGTIWRYCMYSHRATVAATSGEMSTEESRRDHFHESPTCRRPAWRTAAFRAC
jgi:hypothetical protein